MKQFFYSILMKKVVICLMACFLYSCADQVDTEQTTNEPGHNQQLSNISPESIQPEIVQSEKPAQVDSIFVENDLENHTLSEKDSTIQLIKQKIANIRDDFNQKQLPESILERLDAFEEKQINSLSNLSQKDSYFSDETKIYNPHPFREEKFSGSLKKSSLMDFQKRSQASTAQLENIELTENHQPETYHINSETDTSKLRNKRLTTYDSNDPAYISENDEIQFTSKIRSLAQQLDYHPLKMLNYIRDYIEYIPYYGSKKGANACMIEGVGNDFDQSSLLIALLRVGDENGNHKYPSRYSIVNIQVDLSTLHNLFGVTEAHIVAEIFSRIGFPYTLYVDENDIPQFFLIQWVYVEAYIPYGYCRGIIQNDPEIDSKWVPLEPTFASYLFGQQLDVVNEMGTFQADVFFEDFLYGNYGNQTPLEAFREIIQGYLSFQYPQIQYNDLKINKETLHKTFEMIPDTLPFEIIDNIGTYAAVPDLYKHKIQFIIQNKDKTTEFFNDTVNVATIAQKSIAFAYIAASSEDQALLDTYDSIFEIEPISLVNLKPVIKVNGSILIQSVLIDQMGQTQHLQIRFLAPKNDINQTPTQKEIDLIEKTMICGNPEALALNTDQVVSEIFWPTEWRDNLNSEYIGTRKLYQTAHNYLARLQNNHEELATILGGTFTNLATRAIVFNGVSVLLQNGSPYRFVMKGLRIDASSVIRYYHRTSDKIDHHRNNFLFIFGLQSSLDESSIFEDDFQIEAMSTTKGLRMINQGIIPGVSMKKINLSNKSDISLLNISSTLKNSFLDSVNQGNIIYTPNNSYIYKNWEGLVYIDLDPESGSGAFIIGEGLNGGYTVEPVYQWDPAWQDVLLSNTYGSNQYQFTSKIIYPQANDTFYNNTYVDVMTEYKILYFDQNISDWNTLKSWTDTQKHYIKILINNEQNFDCIISSDNQICFHVDRQPSFNLQITNGGSELDNGEDSYSAHETLYAVSDAAEEADGAYILVNWDDDNGYEIDITNFSTYSPSPDLEESNYIQNEDNLAALIPLIEPLPSNGIVELEISGIDKDKIKIWELRTKCPYNNNCVDILNGSYSVRWDLSNTYERNVFKAYMANSLWIEGIESSSTHRGITFLLRYYDYSGNLIAEDSCCATVVMINLGNAVYRNNYVLIVDNERGHAAIVSNFLGPCNLSNLSNNDKYNVIEMQGPSIKSLSTIVDATAKGCYTVPDITFRDRLKILKAAKLLQKKGIGYTGVEALKPETWDGTLDGIQELRCDGLVEVCYEISGLNVWGMKNYLSSTIGYNISDTTDIYTYHATTGGLLVSTNDCPDNLEQHNDYDNVFWKDTLIPATQSGYITPADNTYTRMQRKNLCTPIGVKGGN